MSSEQSMVPKLFQNLIPHTSSLTSLFYIRPVYTSLQLAKKYVQYYRRAANGKGHGMHSPFVFDFILHVLNNKNGYHPPAGLEALRKQLLHDRSFITLNDLGAGSRVTNQSQKTIRRIARTAVKPQKWSLFLYRLVRHYKPQTIIELGTSLGVSTAYMAAANGAATIITIEGSEQIQQRAAASFDALNMGFLKSWCGDFDALLPQALAQLHTIDLAYIDGNHRRQPTLNYFNQLLQKRNAHSIFVFDDIHWSAEMEEAWRLIQQHPDVRYTIDLFFMGLVFFRNDFKTKQHFAIRF